MQYERTSATRWPAAVAMVGVALAAVLAGAPAEAKAADEKVEVVALGDSYAAGVGAGDETGACRATAGAYARLWAKSDPDAVSLEFAACSGDSSSDVVAKRLGALDEDTDLVTVTVGANDLGLVDALRLCADAQRAQECTEKLAAIRVALGTTLPVDLAKMLGAISQKAPKARVVVLGYPVPFTNTDDCPGLPLPKHLRDEGNGALVGINQNLGTLARAAGASFVDVAPRFAGHDLCGNDTWLVGFQGLTTETILHPTFQGQRDGYLAALQAEIGDPAKVLEWMKERDATQPSAGPSTGPTGPTDAAAGTGGSGGGGTLPLTGANIWWLMLVGALLIGGGVTGFLALRPKVIRVASE